MNPGAQDQTGIVEALSMTPARPPHRDYESAGFTRAGLPPTVAWLGTSRVTTAPAVKFPGEHLGFFGFRHALTGSVRSCVGN